MRKLKTLKKNYEFRNVLSRGRFYIGKQIIVYFLKNNKNENRLGIAIQTKLGSAVQRNQAKRYIRQAYQEAVRDAKQGFHIVFIWNKNEPLGNANYHQIREDLDKIFLKAGMNQ